MKEGSAMKLTHYNCVCACANDQKPKIIGFSIPLYISVQIW